MADLVIEWARQIKDIVPFLAISILGGIANLILKAEERETPLTVEFILGEIFLSMFASILVVFLLKDLGAGNYQIGIACGITSISARRILIILRGRFIDKIKSIK